MASYEKLYISKVHVVNENTGVVVEVTKGEPTNVLSIWTQYKDAEGQWQYTGTKSGAKNVRINLTDGLLNFLNLELAKVAKVEEKVAEARKKSPKTVAKTLKAGEVDPELLEKFFSFIAEAEKTTKKRK